MGREVLSIVYTFIFPASRFKTVASDNQEPSVEKLLCGGKFFSQNWTRKEKREISAENRQ